MRGRGGGGVGEGEGRRTILYSTGQSLFSGHQTDDEFIICILCYIRFDLQLNYCKYGMCVWPVLINKYRRIYDTH